LPAGERCWSYATPSEPVSRAAAPDHWSAASAGHPISNAGEPEFALAKSTIVRASDWLRPWLLGLALGLLPQTAGAQPAIAVAESTAIAATPPSPLAVTDEMRSWSAAHLGDGSQLERLRELLAATTGDGPLSIAGISEPTPTAAEAFATRRADCVGYALLFVALSRQAGIDTRFALWRTVVGVDEAHSLHVRRGHLVAVFARRAFGLEGESAADSARLQVVTDRTALALFFSNRAAQSLALGRPLEAVELGWRAVRYDPSLTSVWSNLGVALRRVGDAPGAVLAYEMALRIDPSDRSVRRNLAVARGRAP